MNHVIDTIRKAVAEKYPHSEMLALIESGRVKAEMKGDKVILYVRHQYIGDKFERHLDQALACVRLAFSETAQVSLEIGDAAFAEEIAAEKDKCLKEQAKHAAEDAKRREEEHIYLENERINDSKLPINTKETHTFATFRLLDGNQEAFRLAKEFAYALTEQDYDYANSGRHFFLTPCGPPGTGKTHLALAVGWQTLLVRCLEVRYYQCERFLDTLRRSFNDHESGTYDEIMDDAEHVKVLILDDLGAEKLSDWAAAKLDSLIDFRYVHHLDTVFTTNLEIRELSPRIASRLSEGNVVKIDAPDFRLVKSIQREKKKRWWRNDNHEINAKTTTGIGNR